MSGEEREELMVRCQEFYRVPVLPSKPPALETPPGPLDLQYRTVTRKIECEANKMFMMKLLR
jgi:hypothetical protein